MDSFASALLLSSEADLEIQQGTISPPAAAPPRVKYLWNEFGNCDAYVTEKPFAGERRGEKSRQGTWAPFPT